MKKVFLGLGSNLGERTENIKEAARNLEELIGTISSSSSLYETEPWGFKSENSFLNMVICCETELTPSGVLGRLLMIEARMGRIRNESGYQSRKIDIDILMYNNEIVNEEAIIIPHPRIPERRFVLVPLAEIAPEMIHPGLNKSIKTLLNDCTDHSKVKKYIL